MDLKDTFIPSCFEYRGWERLLSDLPGVCKPLIREFYANVVLREDKLNHWIRGREFTIDANDIDNVLGLEGLDNHDFTNYKDRMLSIETVQSCIVGEREGRCLNTTTFLADMRCLTTIMMFNLYPVRKLTTINNARAIFLMELKENTFIDIGSHIFDTIVDETKTTSRAKLIFPSLLMRLFRLKGVVIPQDISLMPTPSAVNKLTIQGYKFVSQMMKMKVTKEKVNQWRLRLRLQENPQAQGVEARGAELHPHQLYLQTHSRSS